MSPSMERFFSSVCVCVCLVGMSQFCRSKVPLGSFKAPPTLPLLTITSGFVKINRVAIWCLFNFFLLWFTRMCSERTHTSRQGWRGKADRAADVRLRTETPPAFQQCLCFCVCEYICLSEVKLMFSSWLLKGKKFLHLYLSYHKNMSLALLPLLRPRTAQKGNICLQGFLSESLSHKCCCFGGFRSVWVKIMIQLASTAIFALDPKSRLWHITPFPYLFCSLHCQLTSWKAFWQNIWRQTYT